VFLRGAVLENFPEMIGYVGNGYSKLIGRVIKDKNN
jgi:hypothetical protein